LYLAGGLLLAFVLYRMLAPSCPLGDGEKCHEMFCCVGKCSSSNMPGESPKCVSLGAQTEDHLGVRFVGYSPNWLNMTVIMQGYKNKKPYYKHTGSKRMLFFTGNKWVLGDENFTPQIESNNSETALMSTEWTGGGEILPAYCHAYSIQGLADAAFNGVYRYNGALANSAPIYENENGRLLFMRWSSGTWALYTSIYHQPSEIPTGMIQSAVTDLNPANALFNNVSPLCM